jgi:membrane-associated phospholipid phosphatase
MIKNLLYKSRIIQMNYPAVNSGVSKKQRMIAPRGGELNPRPPLAGLKRLQIVIRNAVLCILFFSFFSRGAAGTDLTFSLEKEREWTILGSGVVLFGVGNYLYHHVVPPDPSLADQKKLLAVDRFAIRCANKKHAVISDVTLGVCSLLPLISISSAKDDQQFKTRALMTFESYLITTGLTYLAKGIVRRPRPYVYRNGNSILEKSAGQSFFSGHTSMAFNGAVMAAFLFQEQNKDSRWTLPMWIGGLSAATLTGIFRITSGNHFPTDVLVGALAGSVVGYGMVRLHQ